jgi:hypothetical protein
MGDTRVIESAIEALKERDSNVRRAAAESLGEIGDPKALEPLIMALADMQPWVKSAAIRALGKIGDKEAVSYITTAIADIHLGVREAAVEALGKLGGPDVIEPLLQAVEDEYPQIREAATEALVALGKPAVYALFNVVKHGNPGISNIAIKGLIQLGRVSKIEISNKCCSECFRRLVTYKIHAGVMRNLIFHACPGCRNSSFIDNAARIVALLDRAFKKPYNHHRTTLLVNWYQHKEPFDFDEILIRNAGDFDIDELVMKIRNDLDDGRRKRYKSMSVYLSPYLQLSPGKISMLRDTFGRVEKGA